ncbi:MAG: hypothetical protein WC831_04110 [Parcubacteria group bacterium]|jgi:hypothetical protein
MDLSKYRKRNDGRESPVKTARDPGFSYPSQAKDALGNPNRIRQLKENYNHNATRPYQRPSGGKDKNQDLYQNKLKRLQNAAGKNKDKELARGAAKAISRPWKMATVGFQLVSQIDILRDWPFLFLLIPFAFGKDILDLAFAALTAGAAAIPIIGTGAAGAGMIASFITNVMLQILAVTCLILVRADIKNRGMAKYIITESIEFIAESLPGIDWLPWAVIFAVILYFCVLLDRYLEKQSQEDKPAQESPENQTAPAST